MTGGLLALASPAGAQPAPALLPRVALDYRTAVGLDCPPPEHVRAEIVKELKEDPFTAPGPVVGLFHVVAEAGDPDAIEITVSFDDVVGKRSFKTSFQGLRRSTTCGHLVRTHVVDEITNQMTALMGRTVRALLAARAAAAECSSGSTATACDATRFNLSPEDWTRRLPRPKPDPPPLPERWPTAVRVGLAVGPEVIASGWANVGLAAEVGFRYRSFSLGVEVHGNPPTGTYLTPHRFVTFGRVTGAVLACYHLGLFVGCAVGDAGGILFPHHVQALPAATFYSDVGVHLELESPSCPPRSSSRSPRP